MEMDEVQLEVLNLDGLAMKNQATEQITNIKYKNNKNKTFCISAFQIYKANFLHFEVLINYFIAVVFTTSIS